MELLAMEINKVALSSQDGNGDGNGENLFLSNLLNGLPKRGTMLQNNDSMHGFPSHDFLYSNIMDPFSNPNKIISSPYSNQISHNNNGIGNSTDLYGAIGTLIPGSNATILSPSTSPHTSSSNSSSHSIVCGRCEASAISRCLDCNDALCDDCVNLHKHNSFTKDHYIIGMGKITPELAHLGRAGGISFGTVNEINLNDPQCDIHYEVYRYLCETCKKLVCQECTLRDHKDHVCTPVANVSEKAKDKLQAVLDSGKLGIKYIKTSIDQAVTFSQSVEREALDTSSRIRKAMRHFIIAAEDRERSLLEHVDKYRQQKLTNLSDQMTGLRAALAGLAQTSEKLTKAIDSVHNMNCFDIASTLTTAESQIEKFAAMYKNLQPTEEFITFIQPNFDLLQEIRMQGEIIMNLRSNSSNSTSNGGTPTMLHPNITNNNTASNHNQSRRPIVARSVAPSVQNHAWEPTHQKSSNLPSSMIGNMNGGFLGQCIPGSHQPITVKPVPLPNTTFGFDGHEDGQVSRPWGLCTDKDGNIIIADRRNNRVQVFFADGQFKFKFGSKGTGHGQFDLPAGISSDPQNRIVVVDKDNHRVQVFSSTGMFILKFGSFGKECGQFQYPWDVAVNYKGEILVTDSRNHRIQMFNEDGHFISRFSFDGVNHSRYLKGLTTPRGCCFTPDGDIIVSDFENHRLILIDAGMTKVMSTKGHEGSAIHEFCRPSGICCDDTGRVVVADSKNQRVLIFSPQLEYLFMVEIRPSSHNILTANMDEKDRPSDVSLLPDGRLVVLVETSPDSRDQCSPHKTFIQVY